IVIGSISGLVSSLMTMEQLSQHVLDVSDLKGKRVAYKGETASEERIINHYAPTFKFEARRVESAQKAFDLLNNGDVDAFIHDAPLLLHHANGEGAGDLRVVGKLFENQIYAIAFRTGSDKQETIKRIQLKLQQRGLMDKLKPRYGI
ncbi:transporter substrate-binding domain-containing protein, partial [Verrucomicrobia bacterium]|nr:transporter substrate-binding domain-containing protein [Verrucomicrobiota bacterium]